MTLFTGLEAITSEHEPLAPHTHLRVGGPARWLLRPRSEPELAEVLRRAGDAGLGVRLLGAGANLLVRDEGTSDVVVKLDGPHWRRFEFVDGAVIAGAGASMARLVSESVARGLSGMECMAGIPGSVGGCVRMNAGGRRGSIGELVQGVRVMDRTGHVHERRSHELGFRYRSSSLGDDIVLAVELSLRPDDPEVVKQRVEEMWSYKQASQPMGEHSAGCIFKNPPGVSAGALIERAGFKGRRVGGAEVSPIHANFIITRDGGTSSDVLRLISAIQSSVYSRYEIRLDLEVEVW